jgi:hypothetical protein
MRLPCYDTVQLNDAGIFQYLGNVIFDETDTVLEIPRKLYH